MNAQNESTNQQQLDVNTLKPYRRALGQDKSGHVKNGSSDY